jgi:hypothetical protein
LLAPTRDLARYLVQLSRGLDIAEPLRLHELPDGLRKEGDAIALRFRRTDAAQGGTHHAENEARFIVDPPAPRIPHGRDFCAAGQRPGDSAVSAEAVYPPIVTAEGKPMNAQHDYVIRMSKKELPPAEAFGSVTRSVRRCGERAGGISS